MQINKYVTYIQYFHILFLGILLLLAPCSVRNYIELRVGLEKTEVLNKSKTTFSEETTADNCIADNYTTHLHKLKKPVPIKYNFFGAESGNQFIFNPQLTISGLKRSVVVRNLEDGSAPLYLLYQNLKLGKLRRL